MAEIKGGTIASVSLGDLGEIVTTIWSSILALQGLIEPVAAAFVGFVVVMFTLASQVTRLWTQEVRWKSDTYFLAPVALKSPSICLPNSSHVRLGVDTVILPAPGMTYDALYESIGRAFNLERSLDIRVRTWLFAVLIIQLFIALVLALALPSLGAIPMEKKAIWGILWSSWPYIIGLFFYVKKHKAEETICSIRKYQVAAENYSKRPDTAIVNT